MGRIELFVELRSDVGGWPGFSIANDAKEDGVHMYRMMIKVDGQMIVMQFIWSYRKQCDNYYINDGVDISYDLCGLYDNLFNYCYFCCKLSLFI